MFITLNDTVLFKSINNHYECAILSHESLISRRGTVFAGVRPESHKYF